VVNTITTQANHHRFAHIINQFVWARQQRLKGNIQAAMDQEILAEKALVQLCSDLQCTHWANELLTVWENSQATNPLELPEWGALIYREGGNGCTEDDLDEILDEFYSDEDWR